jgi:predicted O-methyltransferase YrrM
MTLIEQIADEADKWWGWDAGVIDSRRTYYHGELLLLVQYAMEVVEEGGTIVEIGSYGGKTLLALARVAQEKNAHVISVDPMVWYGDKAWPYLEQVLNRFSTVITFYKITSSEAHLRVPLEQVIDFIHIDGNHSDVLNDCYLWLPRLRSGGIVAFHDAIDRPDHADGGYCYQTSMEGSAGYETVVHRKQDQYLLIRRKP